MLQCREKPDVEGKENRVKVSAFLGGGVPRSSIPLENNGLVAV